MRRLAPLLSLVIAAAACASPAPIEATADEPMRRVPRPTPGVADADDNEPVRCSVGGDMRTRATGRDDLDTRWNNGIVPYFLVPTGSEALSSTEITRFHAAVQETELRTPVRFQEFDQAGWDALPGSADIIRVVSR